MAPRSSPTAGLRRLLALAALACSGLAGLAVVALLVRNPLAIILGLLGGGMLVAGVWISLVLDPSRRRLGWALGVGGLLGVLIAVGIVVSQVDGIVWRTLLVGALCVASSFLASRAMEPDVPRTPFVKVTPPRHAVLLCNPWSGGGKVGAFGLVELAQELGVRPVMLDHGLDLEQLARQAVADGADCLGMAGGDGSQALVASIAIEEGLPFVCVSAGTRNHFALDLGLNRDDPRLSMRGFVDGLERQVDVGRVDGRLFVNNVSLGVYATIVQEDGYRDAKVDTARELLPRLLGEQAEPFDIQFTDPLTGEDVEGAFLLMVSNNPYVLDARFDVAQRRRMDSARLGVFAVTTPTGADAAALLALSALNQRQRSPHWHEFTAPSFEVRSSSGKVFAGIDGEALELDTPLRFRIDHRALRVLVPADNPRAVAQQEARDHTVGDLWRLATSG